MNLFQNVKYGVNCREAAERYGVSINRQGKALCPFHNDRHPSLYVADDHFYCFACGAHGDVIDFAANFFDLPLYEAAQRLAADFGVDANQPPTKEVLEKRRQKAEAQQLMENERLCVSVLSDYARACGVGRCSMRRNHQQKHRMNDLRNPVTSWTRRNITWIFLLSGIPMNVPKLSIICL